MAKNRTENMSVDHIILLASNECAAATPRSFGMTAHEMLKNGLIKF